MVGLCNRKKRIRVVALETCGHEASCLEHWSACIPVALVKFTPNNEFTNALYWERSPYLSELLLESNVL